MEARYAVILKGVVKEVVIANDSWQPPSGHTKIPSETANIGDTFENGEFHSGKKSWSLDELYLEANSRQGYLVRSMHEFDVGGAKVRSDLSQSTRSDLNDLRQWGRDNPTATRVWEDNERVQTTLTGAQFVELAKQVGNLYMKLFDQYAQTNKNIKAGVVKTPDDVTKRIYVEGENT